MLSTGVGGQASGISAIRSSGTRSNDSSGRSSSRRPEPRWPHRRPRGSGRHAQRRGAAHAWVSGDESQGPERSARLLACSVRASPRRRTCALPRVLGPLARPGGKLTTRLVTLASAGLASGLALLTALVVYVGTGELARTLASAGAGLLWVSLFHVVPITASALGWYAVIAPVERPCLRTRSEEHTSELQSHVNLVCRLLLEKKK